MAITTTELSGYGPFYVRLDVTAGEQNIAGNYTRFYWALYIGCWNSGWDTWSGSAQSWAVNIAGVQDSGTFTLDFRGGSARAILLANYWIDVPHNADGTRPAFPNYGSISTDQGSVGSGTTVTSVGAATIPRASWARWAVQGTKYAGTTHQLTTQRASTGFTHTMTYKFGSKTGTIGTGITDTVNWTIPLNLMEEIPNTASGTGTITTTTYSGGTVIGTTVSSFGVTAPLDAIPTITDISIIEATSGLNALVGAYVKGLTTLALDILGAAGVYGSTITSYKLEVAGQTINAKSGTTTPIDASGTVSIKATVTDSRGRSATRTETVAVLDYAPPVLNSVSFARSNSGGTELDDGTYFKVKINATVSSLVVGTQKNALKYRISTRVRGTTPWTLKANVTPGGISFNSFRTVGTYSVTNSYDILVEVYDQFSTSAIILVVPVASVFMHWDESSGVGVGKYREDGRLDILGDIFVRADPDTGDKGDIRIPGDYYVGDEPIFGKGSTARRDALFGTPTTVAQQVALANRRVIWFNTDLGWEESYYATTGLSGLTAIGLIAGTAPDWYPTGEGPYSTMVGGSPQTMSANTWVTSWRLWGTEPSRRHGGNDYFTYNASFGRVVCMKAGIYEALIMNTQQAGAGTTVTHLMRDGGSVMACPNVLNSSQVTSALLHKSAVVMNAGEGFALYGTIGSYQIMVNTGTPEVRGEFTVRYKGPLLVSD